MEGLPSPREVSSALKASRPGLAALVTWVLAPLLPHPFGRPQLPNGRNGSIACFKEAGGGFLEVMQGKLSSQWLLSLEVLT